MRRLNYVPCHQFDFYHNEIMCTHVLHALKPAKPVTSRIRFCGKISIFSVLSAVHPSVRPFVRNRFFSLSHLLRDHWSDIFKFCLRCFPRSLVVSFRKWFGPVDKFGRRQPSLIFTFIATAPKELEKFCRSLAYEFLSMSGCVRPKMISVCQKKKKKKKKK